MYVLYLYVVVEAAKLKQQRERDRRGQQRQQTLTHERTHVHARPALFGHVLGSRTGNCINVFASIRVCVPSIRTRGFEMPLAKPGRREIRSISCLYRFVLTVEFPSS